MIATAYKNVKITHREQEILSCLAQGLSSKQIAVKLYISEGTVAVHRKNMLRKTGSRSSAALVRAVINQYSNSI